MTAERPDDPAGGADPSLPAALPVLLQPAGDDPGRGRAGDRRLEARLHPGARARRAAARAVGRRAAGPQGSRGAGRPRPRPRPLHDARHLRARPDPRAGRAAAGGRPGAHPDLDPGRRSRGRRADRRRELGEAEAGRGGHREGAGLRLLDQRRAAPRQPRSHRRDHRPRRGAGGRPARAGEHPVLRLGAREPRLADADPGAGSASPGHGRGGHPALQGTHADPLRPARLLRAVSQAVLRRVGQALPGGDAGREGAALPRRHPHHDLGLRQRARPLARVDLAGVVRLSGLPGRRVDAGAVPELSPEGGRLRRLPVPGVRAHRRRGEHRSGLRRCRPTAASSTRRSRRHPTRWSIATA